MNGDTFVMYRSYFNTYELLRKKRPEDAAKFLDAVVRYGFTGEMPEADDDIWLYNLETIFAQMEASDNKYQRALNNKGGRPSLDIPKSSIEELIWKYNTWAEIAKELGIDADTLRKLRNQYGIAGRTPAQNRKTEKPTQENPKTPTEKPKNRKTETEKPKNLNVNVNNNNNNNYNNYTAAREELDLSITELNKFWYSENIEYAIRDKKVINLGTGEIVHYMTEDSFNRWQEHLKNS